MRNVFIERSVLALLLTSALAMAHSVHAQYVPPGFPPGAGSSGGAPPSIVDPQPSGTPSGPPGGGIPGGPGLAPPGRAPGGGGGGPPRGGEAPGPGAPGMPGGGMGPGIAAPKSKLEEMLEEALRNNPDLKVAAAKVQEAEAELNRTRLEVTRKVVTLYASLDAAKLMVLGAEERLVQVKKLAVSAAIAKEEVQIAERALAQAKAELARIEAEVPYILGKQSPQAAALGGAGSFRGAAAEYFFEEFNSNRGAGRPAASGGMGGGMGMGGMGMTGIGTRSGGRLGGGSPSIGPGESAERILKALDTACSVDFHNEPLGKALNDLVSSKGLTLIRRHGELLNARLDLRLENQPLGVVLEAIGDKEQVTFLIRDYGILAVSDNVPRGAMSLIEFWKANRKPSKAEANEKK